MKILAIAGSNSEVSMNKQLVAYASTLFENAEVEVIDLNPFEMPIYKHERELAGGVPQEAHDFAAKIDGADVLLVSLASITELILQHSKMCSTGYPELKTEQYGMKYQCY
jgi:NAD(P)H-dependent FMN reductase